MTLEVLNSIHLIHKAPLKEEGENKIIAFTLYCFLLLFAFAPGFT